MLACVQSGKWLRKTIAMKKTNMLKDLARIRGIDTAGAADQLDRAVTRVIRDLKRGREAHLPGIGRIKPGEIWTLHAESKLEEEKKAEGGGRAPGSK